MINFFYLMQDERIHIITTYKFDYVYICIIG